MYLFVIHFNVGDISFKNSRHMHFRELVLAEDDEQTCLPTRTIAHHHQFLPCDGPPE